MSVQIEPVELFRMSGTKDVKLREHAAQVKKNSRIFDFVLQPGAREWNHVRHCGGKFTAFEDVPMLHRIFIILFPRF